MIGLTPTQVDTVKHTVAKAFGPGARIWLFGSRVGGDTRGDVDLYVETPVVVPLPARFTARRLLEAALHQKVDLLVRADGEPRTAFEDLAREQGVLL